MKKQKVTCMWAKYNKFFDGRAFETTDAPENLVPNYHDFIRFLPKNEESIYSICLPLYQQGISLREIERRTGFEKQPF